MDTFIICNHLCDMNEYSIVYSVGYINILLHKYTITITNPIFTIGAIIACLVAVIGLYSLADSLIKSVVTKSVEPTVAVIIPGVTVPSNLFLIMLPAIIIVLISHELAHKLAAHTYGLKVKSVGLAFFLFIPGAFVEPDEKEFNKSKPSVRMKILAAGSAANLLVGLLFLMEFAG